MVSIFITAFVLFHAIILFSGIGFYFMKKSARHSSELVMPPNIVTGSDADDVATYVAQAAGKSCAAG